MDEKASSNMNMGYRNPKRARVEQPPPVSNPSLNVVKDLKPLSEAPSLNLDKASSLLSSYMVVLSRRPNLSLGTKKKAPGPTFSYTTLQAPKHGSGEEPVVIAHVMLPPHCPCPNKLAESDPNGKVKSEAKKEACGKLMRELWRCGEVGDDYTPKDLSVRQEFIQSQVLQNTLQEGISSILCKEPIFWKACLEAANSSSSLHGDQSLQFFPTVISFPRVPVCSSNSNDPIEPLQTWQPRPILILTRLALPRLPAVNLLITQQFTTLSIITHAAIQFKSMDEKKLLEAYTLKVMRTITNKNITIEAGQAEPNYLLAPMIWDDSAKSTESETEKERQSMYDSQTLLSSSSSPDSPFKVSRAGIRPKAATAVPVLLPTSSPEIDWNEVRETTEPVTTHPFEKDIDRLKGQIKDGIATNNTEFGRRYEILKLRTDLSPMSKLVDSPREAAYSSLYEYLKSRSRFNGTINLEQPLLEVRRIRPVMGYLRYLDKEEAGMEASANGAHEKKGEEMKYMIPGILHKSVVRASTYKSAVFLPSVVFRIDALLCTKEVNSMILQNLVDENLLTLALSSPTLCSLDGDSDILEFQGDAVLKLISTVYLFATNPTSRQGDLHSLRRAIIANSALRIQCINSGLAPYLQARIFAAKTWVPHGMIASDTNGSKLLTAQRRMDIGDKQLADMVEAILGAAWITGDLPVAWRVAKVLNIGPFPAIHEWADFSRYSEIPPLVPPMMQKTVEIVSRDILGYQFQNQGFLSSALCHTSANHDFFQRLEFLGDAILDLMVMQHIKERWPLIRPEYISHMVSNNAISAFCVESGLYKGLLQESGRIDKEIHNYASRAQAARQREEHEAKVEDRMPRIYWADEEAPKVTSDVVEALLGALMLEAKFDYHTVQKIFFFGVFRPFLDKYIHGFESLPIQPAAILTSMLQQKGCKAWELRKTLLDTSNASPTKTEVFIHETIVAWAICATPQMSNRKACEQALKAISNEIRGIDVLCDCSRAGSSKKPGS
ncbi:dsRNA-specific nuclease Dicer and related ribonucleases [Phaffia rhodozyma]|uniref:DsRNA-specific nuclease Dicer and related ribonucleases n=1 Tax=Phaffia rhodozyma TaxID=264483 RepID=A0A0F7SHL9_PHARH|nr:dsRNA-specific nuclease Dicer and related ribonucleases [Phaffia rhodozyma]